MITLTIIISAFVVYVYRHFKK